MPWTLCPICRDIDPEDLEEQIKRHAAAAAYYGDAEVR